ncbi:glutathione S-transferase family protein [bacterium]|nr:glutathione S-transferase family protein [bacterium]
MDATKKITVFSYRRCPFAMRVRMTLHEKGIAFETREEKWGAFSQELKEKHPEAKVPVLVHGDTVIYESAIITEYIEDAFPKHALLSQDPSQRAQMRLWTYWCNHVFKPHVDHYKYGTARSKAEDVEQAPENLKKDLHKLEATLSQQHYLLGDKLSLADIHVFPFLRQLNKVTPRLSYLDDCPATLKWLEKLLARPAFEKTMEKKNA